MGIPAADPEIRARAVAMRLAGADYAQIARETGVHARTVQRWVASKPVQSQIINVNPPARELHLGQRIAELLNANIEAVTVLARQFSDPRWVASQSAADLIAVYNAVGDRTIQILASVQPATDVAGEREQPAVSAGGPE